MIYIFLFLLSCIGTYVFKIYATKKMLLDIPNERSSHTLPVPHGGGIVIAVTWFVGISYMYYFDTINSSLYFAFLAGGMVSFISYLDDLFGLSVKIRLMVQILASMIGLYFLGGLDTVDLFFFTVENQIVTNLFALLMTVWFINLYNFLDGIDGYAGSEAVFLGLAGFVLFHESYFLVLVVSVLGFLVWNWHQAKIFMGDVGSTLIGYNVAMFTIYYANQGATNLWIWITLFSVFWFDATVTLYRRYKNGERLSQAHNKHAYQRLVQSGWSHSKVVILAMVANLVLFGFVYFIPNVFIGFLLAMIFLWFTWRFVESRKGFKVA